MKSLDLQWAGRVREIAHRWVESHRRRKSGEEIRIMPIGRGPIPERAAEHAVRRAKSIEQKSEVASKKFQNKLKAKWQKSQLRLLQRRRTNVKQKIKNFTVTVHEHADIAALSLKLKWDIEASCCRVYGIPTDGIVWREGVRNNDVLDQVDDIPIRDDSWVKKVLNSQKRPLRLTFVRETTGVASS